MGARTFHHNRYNLLPIEKLPLIANWSQLLIDSVAKEETPEEKVLWFNEHEAALGKKRVLELICYWLQCSSDPETRRRWVEMTMDLDAETIVRLIERLRLPQTPKTARRNKVSFRVALSTYQAELTRRARQKR